MGSWASMVADATHEASRTTRHAVPTDRQRLPASGFSGMLVLGSRGSGKTLSGMHWLNQRCWDEPGLRARIIAPTSGDGVASCIEGVDGLQVLSQHRGTFNPSAPGGSCYTYPNGSKVWIVGTPTPKDIDRLRALTNIEIDVFEEAAANPQLTAAVQQASLSRRRGTPRWVALTTPRPVEQLKKWLNDERVTKRRMRMEDNPGLPQEYRDYAEDLRLNNPRLYRQEVLAEVVDDVEGALWTWSDIERSVVDTVPELVKIAVGVDPAVGRGTTGIVVVGISSAGVVYVLEDASLTDVSPATWANKVAHVFEKWGAVSVIVEDNQGGRLVTSNLQAADLTLPIKTVTASLSKKMRAIPVAALWEADEQRAKMLPGLTKLQSQMLEWVPDESPDSPDRIDALGHATAYLRGKAHGVVEIQHGVPKVTSLAGFRQQRLGA